MRAPTRLGFYCYLQALYMAVRGILRGDIKNGLKLLVAPVGYWRFYPNAIVLDLVAQLRAQRILDVSSPKLASLILSRDHEVLALDLDDPQLETRWARLARLLRLRGFRWQYENATAMKLDTGAFDFIYSLSVIEHIPGQGDTAAMREIARLLKPGGQALIEVPLRLEHTDHFHNYDSKGFPLPAPSFYERHYSPTTAMERLVVPELRLLEHQAMGEFLPVDPWIATPRLPRLLRLAILPFEPFLAAFNLWLDQRPDRGRPLSMILLFEKPALAEAAKP